MSAVIRLFQCRADNYGALVHDPASGQTAAIDVPEAAPVLAALQETQWRLSHILVTHHHADHIAGIPQVVGETGARVVAPARDAARIGRVDIGVSEGHVVEIGALRARVIETPGHTAGHVSYWFADAAAVFAGDTLFSLGCGRLFEGTAGEMWTSLLKLRALPDDTRLYCGHEYTASNARFALTIEPNNAALRARAAEVEQLAAEGRPTLPSTIGRERDTNPFLRADQRGVAAAVGLPDAQAWQVFAEIRHRKDRS